MNLPGRSIHLRGTYYGWYIVGISFISMAFWFGIRSSFSVFYVALLEDFSWGRGESAGVQSMALITYTIFAPLAGGLIDRFGPRRVIGPGIVLLALGLILCASVNSLIQFYLLYGVLVATGVTFISIVSYTALLANWFEKKIGLASGIAVSGMGLGTFLLVPVSQQFIFMWGWRITFVITGGLVLIILFPLNLLFLRHKPQELGLYPDGLKGVEPRCKKGPEVKDSKGSETGWILKMTFRTKSFWALLFFAASVMLGLYMIQVHHLKFLVDMGIGKMTAAFFFALIGVISSIFRIFWGWLSDRIGREKTYTFGTISLCMGVGFLILMDIMGEKALVYFFVIFFGIGWGVTAPLIMAAAADLFKGRGFGLI